jgi:hypothetical protein
MFSQASRVSQRQFNTAVRYPVRLSRHHKSESAFHIPDLLSAWVTFGIGGGRSGTSLHPSAIRSQYQNKFGVN